MVESVEELLDGASGLKTWTSTLDLSEETIYSNAHSHPFLSIWGKHRQADHEIQVQYTSVGQQSSSEVPYLNMGDSLLDKRVNDQQRRQPHMQRAGVYTQGIGKKMLLN